MKASSELGATTLPVFEPQAYTPGFSQLFLTCRCCELIKSLFSSLEAPFFFLDFSMTSSCSVSSACAFCVEELYIRATVAAAASTAAEGRVHARWEVCEGVVWTKCCVLVRWPRVALLAVHESTRAVRGKFVAAMVESSRMFSSEPGESIPRMTVHLRPTHRIWRKMSCLEG